MIPKESGLIILEPKTRSSLFVLNGATENKEKRNIPVFYFTQQAAEYSNKIKKVCNWHNEGVAGFFLICPSIGVCLKAYKNCLSQKVLLLRDIHNDF
ncbi:MAG: hypothetical protein LUQ38_02450 [Methanotrichaceae archaeon]|nr:hypothetical protein [Methanotrichaceae archaeon]